VALLNCGFIASSDDDDEDDNVFMVAAAGTSSARYSTRLSRGKIFIVTSVDSSTYSVIFFFGNFSLVPTFDIRRRQEREMLVINVIFCITMYLKKVFSS